jgi:squalene-hopene/tetraprenyl-beta-curcumene cyclase
MKLTTSLLVLGLPCFLAGLAACTTTKIVEEQEAPKGNTPGSSGQPGDGTTPPDDGALADLAPDWHTKAAAYLDKRAGEWLANTPNTGWNVKCAMSCHTTFSASLAYSAIGKAVDIPSVLQARAAFEKRVGEADPVPFYGKDGDDKTVESLATESVLNAAALSLQDIGKGEALSDAAKSALDRMWDQQGTDGSWAWLEFGLEPWETRNDFGVGMAALVAGRIPAGTSEKQEAGVTKLKAYATKRFSAMVLHDRAVLLWANGSLAGVLDEARVTSVVDDLNGRQRDDGGWSLRSWGNGDLADDEAASDGYATSLATLALCKGQPGGVAKPEVRKALTWIATHQKSDGSWPGVSTNTETSRAKTFMTDAATSYATLALVECGQVKLQ